MHDFSELEAPIHIPDHCKNQKCVTLLSGHQVDTEFITAHIDELKLFVKVAWFGANLRYVAQTLLKQMSERNARNQKTFIVGHWTPSEIIDGHIEYESIVMPKCEQFVGEKSRNTLCKYELTPILKYCTKQLRAVERVNLLYTDFELEHKDETYLLQMYNQITDQQAAQQHSYAESDENDGQYAVGIDQNLTDKTGIYEEIACRFVRNNAATFKSRVKLLGFHNKPKVYIGGIYPKQEETEHFGTTHFVIQFGLIN